MNVRTQNINNLTVETRQTVTFGTNSISYLGPKIWNSLPYHMKFNERLVSFGTCQNISVMNGANKFRNILLSYYFI